MTLERATLTHACNAIRRQVQDEFRDLTLLFVVHKSGKKEQAIQQEAGALMDCPDDKAILRVFRKADKTGQSGFLGLIAGTRKSRIPFIRHDHFYGLFMIDADAYATIEDARADIYHMIWHAIDIHEAYLSEEKTSYILHDNLVVPRMDDTQRNAERNLIADVFAALLLEMQDRTGGNIRKLAVARAMNTLTPVPGYEAENYPYPVAMETTQIVYDDLKDSLDPKLRLYNRAIQLAKEVGMTHDAQSIRQWQTFSHAAQEMAWAGRTPEQILSASIYASEDPYVKAIAYLICEAIGQNPHAHLNLDIYNPFAEVAENERLHRKACDAVFQATLSKALPMYDSAYFVKEAQQQIALLLRGDVLSWCGYGLIEAARIFAEGHDDIATPATAIFWEAYDLVPWKSLQSLSGDIMKLKRRGDTQITRLDLEALLEKYPDLAPVCEYLAAIPDVPAIFIATLPTEKRPEKPQTPIPPNGGDFDFFSGINRA